DLPAATACTLRALASMVSDKVMLRAGLEVSGTYEKPGHVLFDRTLSSIRISSGAPALAAIKFFLTSPRLNEVNHEFPQSRLCQPGLSQGAGRFRTHPDPVAHGRLCDHPRL